MSKLEKLKAQFADLDLVYRLQSEEHDRCVKAERIAFQRLCKAMKIRESARKAFMAEVAKQYKRKPARGR